MDDLQLEPETTVTPTTRVARVTIVFPCLNEERAIGSCVARALTTMRDAGFDGTVLVVDNGSTDRSIEVAARAGAQVVLQAEPGYGAALRSGFEAAETEYVVMADGDGTYELEAIPRLLEPIFNGTADVVLGSRLAHARTDTMPWLHRFIGNPAITYFVRRATGDKLTIRDSQSGFRAFRRDQVVDLNLTSTGMEFASEMLIRCSLADLRVAEIDTTYSERIGESKLNTLKDGLRHLRQIILLSPDAMAFVPGIAMTLVAIAFWVIAGTATRGLGRVGSLSWVVDTGGGVLAIVGPLVLCTGIVMRYRAESSGLRRVHIRLPIQTLIRRFLWTGVGLLFVAVCLTVLLALNFHTHPYRVNQAIASSFSSFTLSAYVDGVILLCTPLLSPFLMRSPRSLLPAVESET